MNKIICELNKISYNEKSNYLKNDRFEEMFARFLQYKRKSICIAYFIGIYFLHVKNNFNKAKKYFLMAIAKGHVDAMFALGFCCKKNKKYKEAKKYYLMAVSKGHFRAMNNLGFYYDTVEKNYTVAIKYYLMAIVKGSAEAMCNLGFYYDQIAQNDEKAKKYYLMSIANGGPIYAMFNLANYYKTKEKNYEEAIKYFTMASKKGDVDAMFMLGECYEEFEKNYDAASKYYLMAVANGDSDAQIKYDAIQKIIEKLSIFDVDNMICEIKQNIDDCIICKSSKKEIINFRCNQKNDHCYCVDCCKTWYAKHKMQCLCCFADIDKQNLKLNVVQN